MKYPIAIEPGHGKYTYGVLIPDIPTFFAASDSFEEAILKAKDALCEHETDDNPYATTIEAHCNNPAYKDCYWTYIET